MATEDLDNLPILNSEDIDNLPVLPKENLDDLPIMSGEDLDSLPVISEQEAHTDSEIPGDMSPEMAEAFESLAVPKGTVQPKIKRQATAITDDGVMFNDGSVEKYEPAVRHLKDVGQRKAYEIDRDVFGMNNFQDRIRYLHGIGQHNAASYLSGVNQATELSAESPNKAALTAAIDKSISVPMATVNLANKLVSRATDYAGITDNALETVEEGNARREGFEEAMGSNEPWGSSRFARFAEPIFEMALDPVMLAGGEAIAAGTKALGVAGKGSAALTRMGASPGVARFGGRVLNSTAIGGGFGAADAALHSAAEGDSLSDAAKHIVQGTALGAVLGGGLHAAGEGVVAGGRKALRAANAADVKLREKWEGYKDGRIDSEIKQAQDAYANESAIPDAIEPEIPVVEPTRAEVVANEVQSGAINEQELLDKGFTKGEIERAKQTTGKNIGDVNSDSFEPLYTPEQLAAKVPSRPVRDDLSALAVRENAVRDAARLADIKQKAMEDAYNASPKGQAEILRRKNAAMAGTGKLPDPNIPNPVGPPKTPRTQEEIAAAATASSAAPTKKVQEVVRSEQNKFDKFLGFVTNQQDNLLLNDREMMNGFSTIQDFLKKPLGTQLANIKAVEASGLRPLSKYETAARDIIIPLKDKIARVYAEVKNEIALTAKQNAPRQAELIEGMGYENYKKIIDNQLENPFETGQIIAGLKATIKDPRLLNTAIAMVEANRKVYDLALDHGSRIGLDTTELTRGMFSHRAVVSPGAKASNINEFGMIDAELSNSNTKMKRKMERISPRKSMKNLPSNEALTLYGEQLEESVLNSPELQFQMAIAMVDPDAKAYLPILMDEAALLQHTPSTAEWSEAFRKSFKGHFKESIAKTPRLGREVDRTIDYILHPQNDGMITKGLIRANALLLASHASTILKNIGDPLMTFIHGDPKSAITAIAKSLKETNTKSFKENLFGVKDEQGLIRQAGVAQLMAESWAQKDPIALAMAIERLVRGPRNALEEKAQKIAYDAARRTLMTDHINSKAAFDVLTPEQGEFVRRELIQRAKAEAALKAGGSAARNAKLILDMPVSPELAMAEAIIVRKMRPVDSMNWNPLQFYVNTNRNADSKINLRAGLINQSFFMNNLSSSMTGIFGNTANAFRTGKGKQEAILHAVKIAAFAGAGMTAISHAIKPIVDNRSAQDKVQDKRREVSPTGKANKKASFAVELLANATGLNPNLVRAPFGDAAFDINSIPKNIGNTFIPYPAVIGAYLADTAVDAATGGPKTRMNPSGKITVLKPGKKPPIPQWLNKMTDFPSTARNAFNAAEWTAKKTSKFFDKKAEQDGMNQ